MNISCRRTSVIGGGGLVARLYATLVTSRTAAHLAPLSMGLSRQEYWVGCHFLPQGIFPISGSLLYCIAGRFFTD